MESLVASTPQEAQAALPAGWCQNLCRGTPHCTQNRKQSEMAVGSWQMAPFLLEHAAAATTSSSQSWMQERYNIKLLEILYPSVRMAERGSLVITSAVQLRLDAQRGAR